MSSNVIQRTAAIAANLVVENILTGSAFEYIRSLSMVSLGIVGGSGLFVTIQAGSTVILEESPIAVGTAFPIQPDTFFYNFGAVANDRLVVRVRNSTGGSLSYFAIVQQAAR